MFEHMTYTARGQFCIVYTVCIYHTCTSTCNCKEISNYFILFLYWTEVLALLIFEWWLVVFSWSVQGNSLQDHSEAFCWLWDPSEGACWARCSTEKTRTRRRDCTRRESQEAEGVGEGMGGRSPCSKLAYLVFSLSHFPVLKVLVFVVVLLVPLTAKYLTCTPTLVVKIYLKPVHLGNKHPFPIIHAGLYLDKKQLFF